MTPDLQTRAREIAAFLNHRMSVERIARLIEEGAIK